MAGPTLPGGFRNRRVPNRVWLGAGVVATALVLLLTIGTSKPDQSSATRTAETVPSQPVAAPPAPHALVIAPPDRPRQSDIAVLDAWARRLAKPTGLPVNLLAAYGRAEMWMRDELPGCHFSWVTLAGIGEVQAVGSGPLPVPDALWQRWSARADNDGKPADPRDVEDAALTAARALCGGGADLADDRGWWNAVLGYTQSPTDTRDMLTAATRYASTTPPPA